MMELGGKGEQMFAITMTACRGLQASAIMFMYTIFWHYFMIVKFKLTHHGD